MADDANTPGTKNYTNRWLVMLPLGIAVLSLVSSIFQSVNYSRQIESAQRNILRAENLKTCKDIIEVFFQFRLKAEEANRLGLAGRDAGQSADEMMVVELKALVYKFGALGTFLANFREEAARVPYTQLTWELLALAEKSAKVSAEDFAKAFASIDSKFDAFNQDCVKAAQSRLI
jgi:hypothetical protein